MVIGRANMPDAFRHAHINKDNLPVVYRYNKKAWMLSGLWYEYLTDLNKEMARLKRRIILVTDNCPSHPPTNKPPKGYIGPPPPHLTHVTLIYLPKNTTPYFQPLDQGIIRSFKASYRRKYAKYLVESFNFTNTMPKPINILQAIHLISEAWLELPPSVVYNCWQEAGIHPLLNKIDPAHRTSYDNYIQYLAQGTSIDIEVLIDPSIGSYHSGLAETMVDEFLFYDESAVDLSVSSKSIDIEELIAEIAVVNLDDTEYIPILSLLPLPTIADVLIHLKEATRYIETSPVATLPLSSTLQVIKLSDMVGTLQNLQLALQEYQQVNRKQQSLLTWLTPTCANTPDANDNRDAESEDSGTESGDPGVESEGREV